MGLITTTNACAFLVGCTHEHEWRGNDWPDGTPAPSEINPAASAGNPVYELRARASASGGAKYALDAGVRLTGNLAAPLQVVRWGEEYEGQKACQVETG